MMSMMCCLNARREFILIENMIKVTKTSYIFFSAGGQPEVEVGLFEFRKSLDACLSFQVSHNYRVFMSSTCFI
jgi:hypothetical protein